MEYIQRGYEDNLTDDTKIELQFKQYSKMGNLPKILITKIYTTWS